MEVGEERGDEVELEVGRDEDVRRAGVGREWGVAGGEGSSFEGADDGGSDGDDPRTACGSLLDKSSGLRRDGVALAVQVDFIDAIHAERREGAEADVKCDVGDFDCRGW